MKGKGKGFNVKGYKGKGGYVPYPFQAKGKGKNKGDGNLQHKGTGSKGKSYKGEEKGGRGDYKGKGKPTTAGDYKWKGKGSYSTWSPTTIFYGACRTCGQTGHSQVYSPLMGLGFLRTCDYCGQTGHSRTYCPVESSIQGLGECNEGEGDYSEPEKEQDDTCIKCIDDNDGDDEACITPWCARFPPDLSTAAMIQ